MSARWLAACGALLVGVLASAPALAVYQCDGETDDCQCSANNPYPCCDNGGGNYGNCTWWGWNEACCNWAYGLPGWGNANQWAGEATVHPDFQVLGNAVADSIACRDVGTYGHVAWVTSVNGGTVHVTEMNCCAGCNNGVRSWSYNTSYFTGGYIVRVNQCQCSPGDTQTQACGNCGQQSRSCGNNCMWGSWSGCSGEGPCAASETETESCGDCGEHTRTCAADCTWGDWGACDGPDPGGGCDTGQSGVCADGVQRCVEGFIECEPTAGAEPEQCNGVDDDCDGDVDEDGVCDGDASTTVPPDGGGGYGASSLGGGSPAAGGDPALGETPGLVGECTCRVGRPAPLERPQLLWLLLAALGLRRRQRRLS
jgi:hypothetical protein